MPTSCCLEVAITAQNKRSERAIVHRDKSNYLLVHIHRFGQILLPPSIQLLFKRVLAVFHIPVLVFPGPRSRPLFGWVAVGAAAAVLRES